MFKSEELAKAGVVLVREDPRRQIVHLACQLGTIDRDTDSGAAVEPVNADFAFSSPRRGFEFRWGHKINWI
jgi:hypothetical protein